MNYFSLIEDIKNTSLQFAEEFYEGDVYEFLNSGDHRYPSVILTTQNVTTDDGINTIGATLFCVDRLTDDSANKLEVQSDMFDRLQHIISTLEEKTTNLESNTYTPFTEKFADLCAGMFVEFSLQYVGDTLCDNSIEIKEIELTKNGIYDIIGYDKAVVNLKISNEELGFVTEDETQMALNIIRMTSDSNKINKVIELVDSNIDNNYSYATNKLYLYKLLYPNLKKVTVNTTKSVGLLWNPANYGKSSLPLNIEEINFPECENINNGGYLIFNGKVNCTSADFKKVKTIDGGVFGYSATPLTSNPFRDLETVKVSYAAGNVCLLCGGNFDIFELDKLKSVKSGAYTSLLIGGSYREILLPTLEYMHANYLQDSYASGLLGGTFPNLKKLVVGTLKTGGHLLIYYKSRAFNAPNFIRLEVGEGTTANLILETWNPTNALSTESNDLVEGNFDNNLQQFLNNFRKYIVDRLATVTTTHTIKVSTAVFNVIQNDTEFDILTELSDKKWTLVDSGR